MLTTRQVPSHSAESWKSYWSNSHELPDKIFAAYDRDSSDEVKVIAPTSVVKPRPKYAESVSESGSNAVSTSGSLESGTDSDYDALEELLAADSEDEGGAGGSFTTTDMRNVVLFKATHPDEKDLWSKFHEKVSCMTLSYLLKWE